MVRRPRKCRQFCPTEESPHHKDARWIHAISEGGGGAGIHMFSVYWYDTGGQGHDRLNAELDE
eukprot:1984929-Heterocapsa_arctica.AAC.1